jgi:N-carbamoyl-L-amino-acid hydrolase
MEHSAQDLHFIASAFGRFAKIGKLPGGGFTRLGYTDTEDRMQAVFASYSKELGCSYIQDEAGNSYLVNDPSDGYCLIASHLDSVIEGGEYDGAAGVIAGLMCLRWARRDGLRVPLRVGAFRCEESSNFGLCTIGSGLITHESYKENIDSLIGKDGRTIAEVFREKGWSLHPKKISGIGEYLEMHIEQGKVLDETKTEVGIVGTIAGPKRYRMYLSGMADHSGATPMSMRNDALCAAAAIILEVERIGHRGEVTRCGQVASLLLVEAPVDGGLPPRLPVLHDELVGDVADE